MTVYADMVFLMNFVYDLEILIMMCETMSLRKSPVRLLLSACLGGIQGLFAFIPYFRILCVPPMGFIYPLFMVIAAFYPCRIAECVRMWLIFLVSAFMLSGAIGFLGLDCAYALLIPMPLSVVIRFIRKNMHKKMMPAELIYCGRNYCTEGFFDSGNLMHYREIPVIIGNDKIFEGLFGKEFSVSNIENFVRAEDICVIPYRTLGKNGAIIGIKMDSAVINNKIYNKIILGYSCDKFSDNLILNGTMI